MAAIGSHFRARLVSPYPISPKDCCAVFEFILHSVFTETTTELSRDTGMHNVRPILLHREGVTYLATV